MPRNRWTVVLLRLALIGGAPLAQGDRIIERFLPQAQAGKRTGAVYCRSPVLQVGRQGERASVAAEVSGSGESSGCRIPGEFSGRRPCRGQTIDAPSVGGGFLKQFCLLTGGNRANHAEIRGLPKVGAAARRKLALIGVVAARVHILLQALRELRTVSPGRNLNDVAAFAQ